MSARRFPCSADHTDIAIVSELAISTAVLTVPSTRSSSALPAWNACG
jgi:hypothetical protein